MKSNLGPIFSSAKQDWETPPEWFRYLDLEFGFTLDPCCTSETAKCKRFFTPEDDGLSKSWADERVFLNPPYAEVKRWVKKAYLEARDNGTLVVCLIPARVDTDWWHSFIAKATEVRFPKGRLRFVGAESSAPFPVAIVIFRPRL
jgi:site-specific DNA-methyltransferase (adenine-specific)